MARRTAPPTLIAIADAPLWQDPLQRHAFAFAVGRWAAALRGRRWSSGLWLRRHGWSAERWLKTLDELKWIQGFGFELGISAPQLPAAPRDRQELGPALQRAGVAWLQLSEQDAAPWAGLLAEPQRPLALARSCHDLPGVQAALQGGADWVTLSPLLATPSKPGVEPLGWPRLQQAIALYPGKIVALGGIDAAQVGAVLGCGAAAAVLRAWQAEPAELVSAVDRAY